MQCPSRVSAADEAMHTAELDGSADVCDDRNYRADALIVLRHFVAGYVNYIDVSLRSFASIISRSDLRMSLPAGEMGNSDRISIRSGSLNRAMF